MIGQLAARERSDEKRPDQKNSAETAKTTS
jgi:hypothetical protein